MKAKIEVTYAHEDALYKKFSNHTAAVTVTILDGEIADLAELDRRTQELQLFCEAKVAQSLERTSDQPAEPESQPELRSGDRGYQEPHPAVDRSRQAPPEPARRPYSQDDYERDPGYDYPEPGRPDYEANRNGARAHGERRNGNGGNGRQGGGGGNDMEGKPPRTGKQFLPWLRRQPPEIEDRVKRLVRAWDLDTYYSNWTDDQARAVYQELQKVPAGRSEWGR